MYFWFFWGIYSLSFVIQDMLQQDSTSSDQIENHHTNQVTAQQKKAQSKYFNDDEKTYSGNTKVMLKISH